MTLRVGIDIVDVPRMTRLDTTPGLADQLFTTQEQHFCQSQRRPERHFAALFAAKEAFLKAVGIALHEGTKFSEIEIVTTVPDQPQMVLHGSLKARFEAEHRWLVSLSHTSKLACAVVALEQKGIS